MTSFTTRVVLHGAEGNEYDDLHTEMEKSGFSRKITGEKGAVYWLPHAEYDYHRNVTRDDVLKKAQAAATTAAPKLKHAVFLTESNGRSWSGLDKV